jgi:hypothetical protein
MKIIDLNGKEIEVMDLPLAILQADDYRHYRHNNPDYDGKQRKYWEDFYQKLMQQQSEQG